MGGVPSGGPPGAAARGTLRGKDAHITTSWYPTNAGTLRLCWPRKPLPASPKAPTPTGGRSRSARLFGPPHVRASLGNASAPPVSAPRRAPHRRGRRRPPLHARRELSWQLGERRCPHRPRALVGALRTAGDVDLPLHGRRELSWQLGDRRCPHVWWTEQTPPRVCSVHHTCGRPLVAPPHRPRALLGALRTAGGVDAPRSTDTTRSTDIRFCIVKTQRRSVTTISRAAADLAIALGARRLQCADQTAIGRDLQK